MSKNSALQTNVFAAFVLVFAACTAALLAHVAIDLAGDVALTGVGAVALTLAAGLAGTWRALGAKAAPFLRNE